MKILLGTDGSPDSRRATAAAATLAQAFGAELRVVAVAVDHDAPTVPWSAEPADHPIPLDRAELWARDEVTFLLEQGIEATAKVLEGHAAEALAKEALAGGFDLLVVGHRGRSGREGVPRTGSVAGQLTDMVACPLLIVP